LTCNDLKLELTIRLFSMLGQVSCTKAKWFSRSFWNSFRGDDFKPVLTTIKVTAKSNHFIAMNFFASWSLLKSQAVTVYRNSHCVSKPFHIICITSGFDQKFPKTISFMPITIETGKFFQVFTKWCEKSGHFRWFFVVFCVGGDGEDTGFCPAHAAMFATFRDRNVVPLFHASTRDPFAASMTLLVIR